MTLISFAAWIWLLLGSANLRLPGSGLERSMALPDVLKETNRALHEDQEKAYIVPETRELIAQELHAF